MANVLIQKDLLRGREFGGATTPSEPINPAESIQDGRFHLIDAGRSVESIDPGRSVESIQGGQGDVFADRCGDWTDLAEGGLGHLRRWPRVA